MDESAYYELWQRQVNDPDPFQMALAGGRLAPSPGLIFVAGYQACMLATFPELDASKWYSFAVSEDRSPDSKRPPVVLKQGRLNGFKTWIAAAAKVDVLVLKVGSGKDAVYGSAEVGTEGLTIHSKPKAGFLPDMSQGVAEFCEAPFTPLQDASGVRNFAQLEPYFIYLAFLARLEALGNAVSELAASAIAQQQTKQDLAGLDRAVGEILEVMESHGITLGDNWEADQKLFTMYSKGIQAKAS